MWTDSICCMSFKYRVPDLEVKPKSFTYCHVESCRIYQHSNISLGFYSDSTKKGTQEIILMYIIHI